jgi:hypothetical protein
MVLLGFLWFSMRLLCVFLYERKLAVWITAIMIPSSQQPMHMMMAN